MIQRFCFVIFAKYFGWHGQSFIRLYRQYLPFTDGGGNLSASDSSIRIIGSHID
jgi:hypothetical protein